MEELQYQIGVSQNQMMTMKKMKYLLDTSKTVRHLKKKMNQIQMTRDLHNQLEFIATLNKQIKSQHTSYFA